MGGHLPLIALAIPSVIIGALTVKPLLFGGGFGESIFFNEAHHEVVARDRRGVRQLAAASRCTAVSHPGVRIWLLAGVFSAWALYIKWPHLPDVIDSKLKPLRVVAREQVLLRLVQRERAGGRQPACSARFSGRPATSSSSTSWRSMAPRTRSASSPASCGACRAASSIPMRSGWSSDSPSCSAGS